MPTGRLDEPACAISDGLSALLDRLQRIMAPADLHPDLIGLRELARATASQEHGVPSLALVDADAWRLHTAGEDWLLWRARRTAARLGSLPIDIMPGESIVGRPELRAATPEERKDIETAGLALASMPPFPGGDAGHFHPDYEKLFRVGIGGIRREIAERLAAATDDGRRTFYRACDVAMGGFSSYVRNVARACDRLSGHGDLARMVERLATEPPSTFHEAIELMFLAMIALWFGEDHGLTAPGRMDQTLRRFYEDDLASGRLDVREAFDLICCLFIQCSMILGAGSALSVMVGGRDRTGRDATNDLTCLCLAARSATRLVYPTVGLAWHDGSPAELMDFACRMLASGIGDPAFFNDELISRGLQDHGVSAEDSLNYMNSTCVEIKVAGASHMWVTAPYFNCPKALLEVMDRIASGGAAEPATFGEFKDLVKRRLADTVAAEARNLDAMWHRRAETGCFPLASCLIRDCLERGQDFDRGGARYNWVENSFVGLANLADGLVAVDRLVYGARELSIRQFDGILKKNFAGHERLRARLADQFPCYGTDDDEADRIAAEMAEFLEDTTASNDVGLHPYVPGFFCWIVHEEFGSKTGATPDGRKAGFPLADGAGASQGRDRKGPTASILSTTKWNHRRALGGLVQNLRFSASTFRSRQDLEALRHLAETYLRRGGFELQVNVVGSDTLRDAQRRPELYQDLLVRVAGYSDYFVHLNRNMQEEVIQRTEHLVG